MPTLELLVYTPRPRFLQKKDPGPHGGRLSGLTRRRKLHPQAAEAGPKRPGRSTFKSETKVRVKSRISPSGLLKSCDLGAVEILARLKRKRSMTARIVSTNEHNFTINIGNIASHFCKSLKNYLLRGYILGSGAPGITLMGLLELLT